MGAYIARRILLGFVTIWLVTVMLFVGLRVVVPLFVGDVVDAMVAEYGGDDPERMDAIRAEYGLSEAVPLQYVKWVGNLLRGDLGESLFNGRSIASEMKYRLPVSIELGLIGLASGVLTAVPMGIVAALMRDRWPDYTLRVFAVATSAVPGFWVAVIIITLASMWWHWAPPIEYAQFHEDPIMHLKIIAMPALLIGLNPSGGLLRIMRAQMLEVLRQDYIRTARAKGLAEYTVLFRHAFRNALIPIVTIIGAGLPGLIAGTALFEIIFILPGMGRYLVSAIGNLDYPVIQGTNIVFAFLIIAANLLVDISYSWIDPRIRYR
ncbi:MAG: ABC transporter permease [Dehalococcoidia bacterium]